MRCVDRPCLSLMIPVRRRTHRLLASPPRGRKKRAVASLLLQHISQMAMLTASPRHPRQLPLQGEDSCQSQGAGAIWARVVAYGRIFARIAAPQIDSTSEIRMREAMWRRAIRDPPNGHHPPRHWANRSIYSRLQGEYSASIPPARLSSRRASSAYPSTDSVFLCVLYQSYLVSGSGTESAHHPYLPESLTRRGRRPTARQGSYIPARAHSRYRHRRCSTRAYFSAGFLNPRPGRSWGVASASRLPNPIPQGEQAYRPSACPACVVPPLARLLQFPPEGQPP